MTTPTCKDCGKTLTAAEAHYYGATCETCEGKAFHASQELDPARPTPSSTVGDGPGPAPLTLDEVRNLSAMQAGAPWTDDLLQALVECIKLYEQCAAADIRPFDPADLDPQQHDAFWEHGALPWHGPAAKTSTQLPLDDCEGLAGTILGMAQQALPAAKAGPEVPCEPTEAQVEAGARSMAEEHWHWDQLTEDDRARFRRRFKRAMTAALAAHAMPPSNPPAQGTGDIRELAERAGMRMNLWSMGAASLAYSDGCEGVTREHLEKFAGLLLAAQPLALTDKQIEKAWRLGFRHACDAERLNSDEEWGYKGANVIETVQALAQAQKEQA